MEVVKDVVKEFFENKFISKGGKPTTINMIRLEDFGEVSLGFTKPVTLPFGVGEAVSINVEKNYGKWEYKGEAPAGSVATMSEAPAAAPKGGGGGGGFTPKVFPVPVDHGDMAIIHQNSLTNAIKLVESDLYTSAWDIDKPGEVSRETVVEEVLNVAYRFADFSSGADLKKKEDK